MKKGKANALNELLVEKIHSQFQEMEKTNEIKSIVLSGQGPFFSFGFDIPEFLTYSKEEFTRFVKKFCDFYAYLFLFPKPVIAALNGHTIAGSCIIALACDYRLMVSGKSKISMNEISFGASFLAGGVEMLKHCVGGKNTEKILYSGEMYSAEEAMELGLINQISTEQELLRDAEKVAHRFAMKDMAAFGSIKKLLRDPVNDIINEKEKDSIRLFIDIWYSEHTQQNLKEIRIKT